LAAPVDIVFPRKAWEVASPESQGVDPARLKSAVDYFKSKAGGDGVRELAIVRNGRMIWQGEGIDKVHGIWSCTKSFTSTVLGLLIADGKCTLETRAADVLPEMNDRYPDVTLRHFTTMTSGYRARGDDTTGSYTHGPSATWFDPGEPLYVPGQAYAYWDSAMNQFGQLLTRTAGEPLQVLFKRRIADPMGMNPEAWDWGDFGERNGIRINGGSGNANNRLFVVPEWRMVIARLGLDQADRKIQETEWAEFLRQIGASLISEPWLGN
jgi:CubicO group peptidase (beta-lactamase class C family)